MAHTTERCEKTDMLIDSCPCEPAGLSHSRDAAGRRHGNRATEEMKPAAVLEFELRRLEEQGVADPAIHVPRWASP